MSAPANVDYASGGYGVYNSAALSDPAIQGVVINVGWNAAEPSRGSYNWTLLDKEANAHQHTDEEQHQMINKFSSVLNP